MFLLRSGAVPLRSRDGGVSWHELAACAPLFKHGAYNQQSPPPPRSTGRLH